jgi:hypothetical protein
MKYATIGALGLAIIWPTVATAQAAQLPVTQVDWNGLEPAIKVEGRRSLSLRLPISTWERDRPKGELGSYWRNQSAAMKWETTYLALSAIDAAQTIRCLKRDLCEEGNPLFGRHPSAGTLISGKLGGGILHYLLMNELNKRDPKVALRTAQISAGLQGGVVAMNARIAF